MSESVDWSTAFIAFGVLLGEPADAVTRALGEPTTGPASALLRELASTSRVTRARAVAGVVTRVVADVERARLR